MIITVWCDQYGQFVDGFDAMRISPRDIRYVTGFDRPRFSVPAKVEKKDENTDLTSSVLG